MISIPILSDNTHDFPDPSRALKDPPGLVAMGGDLSAERLLAAYKQGIFPWFNPGDPILWWSPNPRTVVFPKEFHPAKSLRKYMRKGSHQVTFDRDFSAVIHACSQKRTLTKEKWRGTWISDEIIAGYTQLHHRGYAHSVEVWMNGNLVGGLYGVALGKVFFGESMFSRVDNASKIAFTYLMRQLQAWDFQLVDCQVANSHLFSLGAIEINRKEFQDMLSQHTSVPSGARVGLWSE
jgi:leucyl/phenylalanyl-tRNA---protein transferase